MNIGLLANSNLAIPTLQDLLNHRRLRAVGVPEQGNEYTQQIMMMSVQSGILPSQFSKDDLQSEMEEWIKSNELDVVLVFTFPWLISKPCLDLPKKGFYNVHFAPLPEYRGAAPLFWLIKNQAGSGGFSIHEMTTSFDDGRVVFQRELALLKEDTLGLHMGKLSMSAIQWTNEFLVLLEKENLTPVEQDSDKAKEWATPEAADLMINWANQTAEQIKAQVLAANPYYGGAITFYQQSPLRILDLTIVEDSDLPDGISPGTILNASNGSGLFVACKDSGVLRIDVIKLEEGYFSGAKLFEMGIEPGTHFTSAP